MSEKKPWFMLVLARIGQKARNLCGSERVQELGEGLLLTELYAPEWGAIIDELNRMLREEAAEYEQASITYLRLLKERVERKPWYMVALERMTEHAKRGGMSQLLTEDGLDLRLSELSEEDRQSIVWELERMVREEGAEYGHNSMAYFNALREQIEKDHS